MSDEPSSAPVPASAETGTAGDPGTGPEQAGEPRAARRRSALPWILLAAGGVLLLILGLVVAFVIFPGFVSGRTDPVATVEDFDRAYEEVDCELFQDSTTERFREVSQGSDDRGVFDCASWEELAADYTVDGEYRYKLDILGSTVEGDQALVLTRETDLATEEEFRYSYTLVPDVDGHWLVEAIVETDG